MTSPRITGGPNIALKIPTYLYEQTVAFYRDTLKLEVVEQPIEHSTVSRTHKVVFGGNVLWLDCVDGCSRGEAWLELQTDDVAAATTYLQAQGTPVRDELEELPDGSHWISDPAGNVFIVNPRG